MNSATMIPAAPKVPSDFIFLLTYCAGAEMTRGEVLCEEMGILDGSTQVDQLA
jgi:hypothetical protein